MKGFVYVISAGDVRHKIGMANDPEVRLRSLRTGVPDELTLIHSVEVSHAQRAEAKAHQILAGKRIRGEWFDCSAEEAIAAVNSVAADYPIVATKDAGSVENICNESMALILAQIAGMLLGHSGGSEPISLGPPDYPFPAVLMEAAQRLLRAGDD